MIFSLCHCKRPLQVPCNWCSLFFVHKSAAPFPLSGLKMQTSPKINCLANLVLERLSLKQVSLVVQCTQVLALAASSIQYAVLGLAHWSD